MESKFMVESLKKALKLKGITYGKLAQMLEISETSVKRVFSEGTFTLDRFIKICNLIGLSYQDLFYMIEADLNKEFEFNLEQEEFFAKNFNHCLFFFALHQYGSVKTVVEKYNIDKQTTVKLLADLEKAGFLEWLPGDEAKLLVGRKFILRDGPIIRDHYDSFMRHYADWVLNNEGERLNIYFLGLSKGAQKRIKLKFEELRREIRREQEMEVVLKTPTEFTSIGLDIRPYPHFFDQLQDFRL
jgi:DNA-binding MarR family transcriptional regulator